MICRENVILYDKYGTFYPSGIGYLIIIERVKKFFYPSVLSFQNYLALKNGRENGKNTIQFRYHNRRRRGIY